MTETGSLQPQVSVIIPTLGRRSSLRQAVESALSQVPAPAEVIVVFDLAEPPENPDLPDGVRILSTGGVGVSGARNLGIEAATGDAVALLDDDDYFLPGKFAAQIPLLIAARERGERAVITCAFEYVSNSGELVQRAPQWLIRPGQDVAEYLFRRRRVRDGGSGIPPGSMLVERSLFDEIKFDPNLRIHEDWDWILRVHDEAGAVFHAHPGCFFAYRMRAPGEPIATSHLWQESVEWAEVRRGRLSPRPYGDFLMGSAALAISAGDRLRALQLIFRGVRRGRPGLPAIGFAGGLLLLPRGTTQTIYRLLDRLPQTVPRAPTYAMVGRLASRRRSAVSSDGSENMSAIPSSSLQVQGSDPRVLTDQASSAGTAQWIRSGDAVLYSVFHRPAADIQKATAVLFVPPFGWDEVETHRARREWAIRLAQAGFPSLRFDLPGTGESSGGARDDNLVDAWVASVRDLVAWLRAQPGVSRVAVIGIGLGGTITLKAASDGAEIDDLVLWAVKANGRSVLREMIAYGRVVASRYPEDQAGDAEDPGTVVTGFYLAKAAEDALRACNAADMVFPEARGRRALVLSRDSQKIDEDLVTSLRAADFAVQTAETRDYGDLTTHPQSLTLRRPTATMERVTAWLGQVNPYSAETPALPPPPAAPVAASTVERFSAGATAITEKILEIDTASLSSFGVLSEPIGRSGPAPFMAILISAGAIRKIGPHRMWVEISRRWAARGVPTLRVDIRSVGDASGIGDQGGDERDHVSDVGVTSPTVIAGVAELLDVLVKQEIAERFFVVGYCSGAYVGTQLALTDRRVLGVVGLNQEALVYDEAIHQTRMLEQIAAVFRSGVVARLREGVSRHQVRQLFAAIRYWMRSLFGFREVSTDRHEAARRVLDHLAADHVSYVMVNSQSSRLWSELGLDSGSREWPQVVLDELPTKDHMARAIWLQRIMHQRVDDALERVIDEVGTAPVAESAEGEQSDTNPRAVSDYASNASSQPES
jgi:pimeloyl-ACP methyl ester carboxylesterase